MFNILSGRSFLSGNDKVMKVEGYDHTPFVLGKEFCFSVKGTLEGAVDEKSEVTFSIMDGGTRIKQGIKSICNDSCGPGQHTFKFCFQFPSWPGDVR